MTQSALTLLKHAVDEAVRREGLRAFAARTGVPLGVVRGTLRDQNLTAASISMLARALDLEFYVGPRVARATLPAISPTSTPVAGLAEEPEVFRMTSPGSDAWAHLDRPAPAGPFFIMRGDAVLETERNRYCLVEPDADLPIGGLVYLEDRDNRVAIGEYRGAGEADGWIKVLRHGAAMTDERAPGSLRRVAAVTWSGRTPPPAALAGFTVESGRNPAAQEKIDDILADLRQQLRKTFE